MMQVYLDNAATTSLDPEVLVAMLPYMDKLYGNPSSLHAYGRIAKVAIEKARRSIADLLSVSPAEIFFTSGGTEGNNLAIRGAIESQSIQHIITSPIEHLSVLEPIQKLTASYKIPLHYIQLDAKGRLNYVHLEELLQGRSNVLVSLMHGNNEIGNLNDLSKIGEICHKYNAIFHTDAVQTAGHYLLNLSQLPVDILVGSAHKFHGPKGIGFIYIRNQLAIAPQIIGGSQERTMRAGTENIAGVVGLGQALCIAHKNRNANKKHIENLKKQMIDSLQASILGIDFYGNSADLEESIYTLLSIKLPTFVENDMLLFNLDIHNIAASSGSACTSGTQKISHVIQALYPTQKQSVLRFSFSKYNTATEIAYVVNKLVEIYDRSA